MIGNSWFVIRAWASGRCSFFNARGCGRPSLLCFLCLLLLPLRVLEMPQLRPIAVFLRLLLCYPYEVGRVVARVWAAVFWKPILLRNHL